MSHLTNITPEQRQEMLAKASEKKQAKRKWAEKNLRTEWEDEKFHRELASKYGYRMPQKIDKAGSKFVNRFLKKFGLDKDWYVSHTGFANGNKESEANPTMNAAHQVGLLLECYHYEQLDN